MSSPTFSDSASLRKSQVEEDHLIRSTKKIKNKDSVGKKDMDTSTESDPRTIPSTSSSNPPVEAIKVKSFKEALVAPQSTDFYFDAISDTISPNGEDEDGDTNIHEDPPQGTVNGIPNISLPKKLLQQIRQPQVNTLIVRLLGKSIGYRLLCTRVKNLWGLQDDFTAVDLGNNYFLFKFSSQEDCAQVYSGQTMGYYGPLPHNP